MFRETWISAFWTVIGPIDFDDFQVCDFPLLSCCFWMIFMFSGALTKCFFDSRWAFKVKVGSHESTSWRHDFGRSPKTKIMKFHDCNFLLFSLLILIVLVGWRVQNVCFCWFYISFTDVSCNLNFGILDGHRTTFFNLHFEDFQVSDFALFSLCFLMISMFSGALAKCCFQCFWLFSLQWEAHVGVLGVLLQGAKKVMPRAPAGLLK